MFLAVKCDQDIDVHLFPSLQVANCYTLGCLVLSANVLGIGEIGPYEPFSRLGSGPCVAMYGRSDASKNAPAVFYRILLVQ